MQSADVEQMCGERAAEPFARWLTNGLSVVLNKQAQWSVKDGVEARAVIAAHVSNGRLSSGRFDGAMRAAHVQFSAVSCLVQNMHVESLLCRAVTHLTRDANKT